MLGIFKLAFANEQLGKLQTHIDAVGIRRFQSAGEAVHGGLTLTKGHEGIAGGNVDRGLVGSTALCSLNVTIGLITLSQLRVGRSQIGIDQRIVGRQREGRLQLGNRLVVMARMIQRVGERHVQLQIIRRILQGQAIFVFGFVEHPHLPVGGGVGQVGSP